MTENQEKPLTASLKADRLWSKLKVRAVELRHGRLQVNLVVREGHVVRVEVTGQQESLIPE